MKLNLKRQKIAVFNLKKIIHFSFMFHHYLLYNNNNNKLIIKVVQCNMIVILTFTWQYQAILQSRNQEKEKEKN
jgi:hypothetical protein